MHTQSEFDICAFIACAEAWEHGTQVGRQFEQNKNMAKNLVDTFRKTGLQKMISISPEKFTA